MKKSFNVIVAVLSLAVCVSAVSCGNKKQNEVYDPISSENLADDGTAGNETAEEPPFISPLVRTVKTEISNRPDASRYSTCSPCVGDDKTCAGYFVKPVKGKTLTMFSWPSKKHGTVVGTFSDNETGVVLYSYSLDKPVPICDRYVLIRNLDTGKEGWVFSEYEFEPNLLFTCEEDKDDEFSEHDLVNATVRQKCEKTQLKGDDFKFNSDGTKYAVLSGQNVKVYNIAEEEPFVIIDGTKFTPSLTKNTIFQFSSDSENLYILQEEGNLFNFNFEEGATSKIHTFNFEEQNQHFEDPQYFAVSPDNRFFYVVAIMSNYSRRVPRILVYDVKKEQQDYFDIRGKKDIQSGYYNYKGIQFSPEGEALINMNYYDETVAVRFFLNGLDKLTSSVLSFEDSDITDVIYSDDYKSLICIKHHPGRMEKVSFEGKVYEESRKYIYDPFTDKSWLYTNIIPDYEKGIFAAVCVDTKYSSARIYLYSLKTLNLLYSFYATGLYSYNSSFFYSTWIGDKLYASWQDSSKLNVYTLDITEKNDQLSLVYDWDERLDKLCSQVSNIDDYENLLLNVEFTHHGFYHVYSTDAYDYDNTILAKADGIFEFRNDSEVMLREAGNGLGDVIDEGEEEVERRKTFLKNIPVLYDDGTIVMYVQEYWKDNEERGYKVICPDCSR